MDAQKTQRRWASRKGAAAYAALSLRTLDQRVADGHLAAYRPNGGRRVMIDLADVDAMIEGNGRRPTAHVAPVTTSRDDRAMPAKSAASVGPAADTATRPHGGPV